MGTRGIIARKTPGGWLGRYHHWDSNPQSLGKAIFELANGHFKGHLDAMMAVLIDDHTGWSTIVEKDFKWVPQYINPGSTQAEVTEAFEAEVPQCYCHGARRDEGWLVKPKDRPQEWGYVINVKKRTMDILHGSDKGWTNVGTVPFDAAEPDWAVLECGKNRERCSHYDWVHDKTVCRGCNGKKHQASSGHSAGWVQQDCAKCVTFEQLPEPLKSYVLADTRAAERKGWHYSSPRICTDCGGTGKAAQATVPLTVTSKT